MSSTLSSSFLALAVITTGLYAGFMLTFLIAIMPGIAALPDERFTAAMRRFNEKVPGPAFLALFLGVIALPAVVVFGDGGRDRVLAVAALVCAVGGHLITIAGNIPLNKALAESEGGDDSAARAAFESPWNRLHRIRTVLSLAAFALLAVVGADF
ncbi:anthrone oxygenase family protein [Streptomyces sp. WC2508]|uniref:anthrone oxygenase family protein n=1 Tax=Streptomyces sp. WC2508 TaxID=3461405 RepID=UPI0040441371